MIRNLMLSIILILLNANFVFALEAETVEGIPGNVIVPLKKYPVRMESMAIKVKDESGKTEVTATFVLRNLSNTKMEIEVGFPFSTSVDPLDGAEVPELRGFSVKSNNERISFVKKENTTISVSDYGYSEYDYLYVWKISFKPDEIREISCSYNIRWEKPDYRKLNRMLKYILREGALWESSVGRINVTVTLADYLPEMIEKSMIRLELRPKGYKLRDNKIIDWVFVNSEPLEDIEIDIVDVR